MSLSHLSQVHLPSTCHLEYAWSLSLSQGPEIQVGVVISKSGSPSVSWGPDLQVGIAILESGLQSLNRGPDL